MSFGMAQLNRVGAKKLMQAEHRSGNGLAVQGSVPAIDFDRTETDGTSGCQHASARGINAKAPRVKQTAIAMGVLASPLLRFHSVADDRMGIA